MQWLPPGGRGATWALLAILAGVAALYAPSLGNGFVYDDAYVARSVHPSGRPNALIAEPHPLTAYFGAHYWQGEYATHLEYRPVTIASYAAVYQLLGRRPGIPEALPQHALNWLLHLLGTALVYRLVRALRAPRPAALAGAAVFGVHAVHSEVVASVVGRAELLAFCAGAGAVLVARRFTVLRAASAAALCFVAFGAKESALAWPGFGVVLELVRRLERRPDRPLLPELATACAHWLAIAAVPLAAFLALRGAVLAGLPPVPPPSLDANPLAHLPTAERLMTATMVWGVALAKSVWPYGLAADYGRAVFTPVRGLADPRFWIAALALLGVGLLGLRSLRERPLLFAAAASFFGFSLLTSNVPVVIGTVFGERLLYTPSLGLSFAVASGVAALRRERRLATGLAVGLGLVWAVHSAATLLERNRAWRSDADLYLTDAARQPRSVKLAVLASDVHAARGDRAGQFAHLARAVAFDPDPARTWLRLAFVWLAQESPAEAAEAARRGLAAAADASAQRLPLEWALSEALRGLGQGEAADRHFRHALAAYRELRLEPPRLERLLAAPQTAGRVAGVWLALADHLLAVGAPEEAERALRIGLEASRRAPAQERFALHWALAGLLAESGQADGAARQLERARAVDPRAAARRLAALPAGDARRALAQGGPAPSAPAAP